MDEFKTRMSELHYRRQLAAWEECVIRESAYLPVTFELKLANKRFDVELNKEVDEIKLEVEQFTLLHFLQLDFCASPFVQKTNIEFPQLMQFLWIVSTRYKSNDIDAFRIFCNEYAPHIDFQLACSECIDYYDKAMLDFPKEKSLSKKRSNKVDYYSWITTVVHILAKNYGWTIPEIRSLPIAVIMQHLRIIEESIALENKTPLPLYNERSDHWAVEIDKALKEEAKRKSMIVVTPDSEAKLFDALNDKTEANTDVV